MSSKDLRKQKIRVPKQERSIQKFEAVVAATLKLMSTKSYESISMREIAREATMPIASVYQYFPTKLAIVHEIWLRYTNQVFKHLEADLATITDDNDINCVIDRVVNLMVVAQTEHPAFNEVWACVAAAPELCEENIKDTQRTASLVAKTLAKVCAIENNPEQFDSIALVMCEGAASVTKMALALDNEVGKETLAKLKEALRWMYDGAIKNFDKRLPEPIRSASETRSMDEQPIHFQAASGVE